MTSGVDERDQIAMATLRFGLIAFVLNFALLTGNLINWHHTIAGANFDSRHLLESISLLDYFISRIIAFNYKWTCRNSNYDPRHNEAGDLNYIEKKFTKS